MKIVHLCLACFYPDGFSYQENMLPKFHKKMGYDVEVIASLLTFDNNGSPTYMNSACEYDNEYGIHVFRLAYKKPNKIYKKLNRFINFNETLEKTKPDILFIHGCQFLDMDIVKQYVIKNSNIKVFIDNHADFSNSATNFLSKNILHKIVWRHVANSIEPYVQKFYGVLPARVDFLTNIYKLPESKVELLVMGADDDKVNSAQSIDMINQVKTQLGIHQNEFVLITGGKIDSAKRQTLLLMKAVKEINNVKLIIFGSVENDIKEEFDEIVSDSEKIIYLGWLKSEDTYPYIAMSDLAVFPGRHSVLWEQTAGQGLPMICKYWEGTTHIDGGGNIIFLYNDSVEEIKDAIQNAMSRFGEMRTVAKQMKNTFMYSEIARKSLDA